MGTVAGAAQVGDSADNEIASVKQPIQSSTDNSERDTVVGAGSGSSSGATSSADAAEAQRLSAGSQAPRL